jgi:hypothetical protein
MSTVCVRHSLLGEAGSLWRRWEGCSLSFESSESKNAEARLFNHPLSLETPAIAGGTETGSEKELGL